jgi:hypothetical protein
MSERADEEKARNEQRRDEEKAQRDAFCRNLREEKWGSNREKELEKALEKGRRL